MNIAGGSFHPLNECLFFFAVSGSRPLTFQLDDGDAYFVDYLDYHLGNDAMKMHNPSHPGETLREDVLPALGLAVAAAADQLGVTQTTLSRVLDGQAPISTELALRLEA